MMDENCAVFGRESLAAFWHQKNDVDLGQEKDQLRSDEDETQQVSAETLCLKES